MKDQCFGRKQLSSVLALEKCLLFLNSLLSHSLVHQSTNMVTCFSAAINSAEQENKLIHAMEK